MAGTKIGGIKARDTNTSLYGKKFYKEIGAVGGRNGNTGGFASDKIGDDGLTGRQRASIAGSKGGKVSRRGEQITMHYTVYNGEKISIAKLAKKLDIPYHVARYRFRKKD